MKLYYAHYNQYGYNERRNATTSLGTVSATPKPAVTVDPNKTTLPKPTNVLTHISGDRYITFGKTNFVMDVQFADNKDGAGVCIQEKGNPARNNQLFTFVKQSDDSYMIVAKHSGKALEVSNNSKANGARVQQWSWDASYDCKRWWVVDSGVGDGTVFIINKYNGLLLDLDGGRLVNGNRIHMWERGANNKNKFWTLVSPDAQQQNGSAQASNSATVAVAKRLEEIARMSGMSNGAVYKGAYASESCKGFARDVTLRLFNITLPSTKTGTANYAFNASNDLVLVAQKAGSFSADELKGLLANARPGDVVQCSKTQTNGAHSYLFLSHDGDGIRIYDANVVGANVIRYNVKVTYAEIARTRQGGVSLYTVKNYK